MIPPTTLVIGIDLGGTKALVGLVAGDGSVRSRVKVPSRDLKDQPVALLDRLADTARQAAWQGGAALSEVAAVGVGLPGPLDPTRSVVRVAPNLGWEEIPARAELERRLGGPPVWLENDVRAAALGEFTLGAGAGRQTMLAIFVGTGVGGGLIINGELFHGTHGGAGEIGHMVIAAGGPRCPCGRRGCLEALAARGAVARYVAHEVKRGRPSVLTGILGGELDTLTSGDLARAIKQDDRVAIRAARKSAHYVGLATGSVINLLDPDVVVLGGGVVEALGQQYVDWAARKARPQVLSDSARGVPIVASQLGDDAGLLGAALVALRGPRSLTAASISR